MARVLVSAYSNVTWTNERLHDSFVAGLIRSLQRNGNEVLVVRTNEFLVDQTSSASRPWMSPRTIVSKIKSFDPELIITFNNSLPSEDVIKETNCPILLYASDAPAFFVARHLIEHNPDRYFFLELSDKVTAALKRVYPQIAPSHYIPFGHATDLRAESLEQDISISFVGSIGNYSTGVVNYFKSFDSIGNDPGSSINPNELKDEFFKQLDEFRKDSMSDFGFDFPNGAAVANPEPQLILMLTCKQRFDTLKAVSDLGLKIFGFPSSWSQILQYDFELFRCFDYSLNVSLDHATSTYNRSQISMNLPHGQTTEGFSWRVCEILASNGVLLSNKKQDLIDLMSGFANLPTYESPAEARELAKKLLDEPNWRADLSAASKAMIEVKCRFETKFKEIENRIAGISLLLGDSTGSVKVLEEMSCVNPIKFAFRFRRDLAKLGMLCGEMRKNGVLL
ncbi:MAG: hypothetical protein EOP05_00375 [Proteobacteria bacterium]|nr:MAG: hypothetical protein EOP05_00375 [Pseudomonadota bacterium]